MPDDRGRKLLEPGDMFGGYTVGASPGLYPGHQVTVIFLRGTHAEYGILFECEPQCLRGCG